MVDTKTPGDKTLSMPSKTLSLKPRVETGTVRQSFSPGRSKQVVVEKRGKRRRPGARAGGRRRAGGEKTPGRPKRKPSPAPAAKASSRPNARPPKPAARPR